MSDYEYVQINSWFYDNPSTENSLLMHDFQNIFFKIQSLSGMTCHFYSSCSTLIYHGME